MKYKGLLLFLILSLTVFSAILLSKNGNTVKTIFMNYLEFHNAKLEMNLEKVNNLIFQVYFDFFFMNDCFV